ncbi:MAG: HD-GYP domain-containing protein [Eubacteriales bacterium]
MIFVDVNHLKPGMICAKEVTMPSSLLPLLTSGQILTEDNILRLKTLNFPGIYIETKLPIEIGCTDFIDPSIKNVIASDLRSIFTDFPSKCSVPNKLIKKMEDAASELVDFILQKDQYILNVLEIKTFDAYTYSHSINVATLCTLIGLQLGYSLFSLKELALAGLMHDLGKLDIPLNVLNKPSPLNSFEFDIMKKHPELGVKKIQNSMRISSTVISGIASHHEKFDGSGYPQGLEGCNIPLCARIIAVADVFDALTTSRVYRAAMTTKDTLDYMASCSGSHFDPYLIDAFFKTVSVYPVGVMVRLSDASIAVVIENISGHMLDPIIKILDSKDFEMGDTIDLSKYENLFIVNTLDSGSDLPDDIFE